MKKSRIGIILALGILACGCFPSSLSAVLQEDQYQYGSGSYYYINGALRLEKGSRYIGQYVTPELPWMGQVEFYVSLSDLKSVKLEIWGCDAPNGNPTTLLASVAQNINPIGGDWTSLIFQLDELIDVTPYYATAPGGMARLFVSLVRVAETELDDTTGMLIGLHDIYKYTPPPGLGFDTYPQGQMRSGIPGSVFNPDDPNDFTRHPNYDAAFTTWGDPVVPAGQPCGSPGTFYFAADLNYDCYIALGDFAVLAQDWLKYTSPREPVLDQSQEDWNTANGVSTTDFVAQSFTQGPGCNLQSIWIRNYAWETFPAKLVCELRASSYSNPFALAVLASVEKTWETLPADSWLAFDFGDIPVTPGNWYTFVIKGTDVGHVVPGLWNGDSAGDHYAGGMLRTTSDGGGYWNQYWNRDLTFRTYSDNVPDQKQTDWNTAYGLELSPLVYVAQSFTQGEVGNLSAIWIRNYAWETFPAKVTLELRDGASSGNPLTIPVLASVTKEWNTLPADSWLPFDFGDIPVTPGKIYTFVVYNSGIGRVVAGLWNGDTEGDRYAGGVLKASFDGGTSWNNYWTRDLTFMTFSGPAPIYLPTDLNKDSYVKIEDLALLAQDWLSICSDPMNVDCDIYWR